MLFNQVLDLPAKSKLVWERFTSSKLTIAYAIFSLVHFAIQFSLQIRAYTINAEAAALLYSISVEGNATNSSFPAVNGDSIRMCAVVPTNLNTDKCTVVYNSSTVNRNGFFDGNSWHLDVVSAASSAAPSTTVASSAASAVFSSATSATAIPSSVIPASSSASPSASLGPINVVVITEVVTRSATATPFATASPSPTTPKNKRSAVGRVRVAELSDQTMQVNITGLGFDNYPLVLDSSCMWSLNWPVSILDNTKREDVVFMTFQIWVLGMSMVALLNESFPHIFASFLTHVLATAWSGFQIYHTANFKQQFDQLITHGACAGPPSLLRSYWSSRAHVEIPILALNAAALVISAFLSWKLVKLFEWQTFKNIGASLTINRIYKLVLLFSIVLQLGLFFMAATVSLFLDQLINGWAVHLAWYRLLYQVMFIITALLLVPWLVAGWFSVRREKRLGMILFLAISGWYLAGWGVMFLSTTFRWTFETWQFFALVALFSVFFSLLAFVLGVVCRYNFGKGLLHYLHAQETLPGDDYKEASTSMDEKVSFPSTEKPVPTYSATFGSGSDSVRRPSPQLGPRFFNQSAEPFESRSGSAGSSPIVSPMAALTRTSSLESYRSNITAMPNKRDSGRSLGSLNSYYDYSAGDSNHARRDSESQGTTVAGSGSSKRWVIDA